jgi:hypothetical protein
MTSDEEKKKREIFEAMSPRRQQRILQKGYDKWDPFLAPKEPPFFRKEERDKTRGAAALFERFLREGRGGAEREREGSPAYVEGAREICFGLARREERFQGMHDFCLWLTSIGGDPFEVG